MRALTVQAPYKYGQSASTYREPLPVELPEPPGGGQAGWPRLIDTARDALTPSLKPAAPASCWGTDLA
jgi:hypothetical protein